MNGISVITLTHALSSQHTREEESLYSNRFSAPIHPDSQPIQPHNTSPKPRNYIPSDINESAIKEMVLYKKGRRGYLRLRNDIRSYLRCTCTGRHCLEMTFGRELLVLQIPKGNDHSSSSHLMSLIVSYPCLGLSDMD